MRAHVQGVVLSLAAAIAVPSCASRPVARVPAVAFEATRALFDCQAALQARPERTAEARASLERAALLAPGWIAPLRWLDELDRQQLRGVDTLRAHRAVLARDPSDARRLYLAGRLEGKEGRRRFEQAVHFDPDLAWGWHGLSFAAAADGEHAASVEYARRALDLALDPWERTFFRTHLARQLAAADRSQEALELLEDAARSRSVTEQERTQILVAAVEIGLQGRGNRARERAYERGLQILRERDLFDSDIEGLVPRLKSSLYLDDIDSRQLALALASRPGPTRERLRAELGASTVSRAVLDRALQREGQELPAGARERGGRFSTFDFAAVVERWRAALPRVVLGPDGLPLDPGLADVVRRARALDAHSTAAALEGFGDALIAVGWFREARQVAARLSAIDLDSALALENRAFAGLTILDGLERIARRSDGTSIFATAGERGESEASKPVRSLADLLDALAPVFARADVFLGGETDVTKVRRAFRESPRMEFAGLAELVHPGPRFSAADERDEIGQDGDPVRGVARYFARIGRFAILGQVVGGGAADASVLPLVWLEERSGVHLGVPWRGTVAWCEAADLKSRAGRYGAMISAAALHEGYWVDIDSVREEHAGWLAFRRRLLARDGLSAAGVKAVLDSTGLVLDAHAEARERASTTALLGEANRVRLAVLADHAQTGQVLGDVSLDEMIEVTAIHEEGHLCDRARFLPLLDHKLAILRLLARCNFSPQRVGEELEYRAQLTCLCDSPDPRIALAQVLDAGEGNSASAITPHTAAYKRLLDDLLQCLDDALCGDPHAFPLIDSERTLAHQLHRLGKEDVRRLGRMLAARRGL